MTNQAHTNHNEMMSHRLQSDCSQLLQKQCATGHHSLSALCFFDFLTFTGSCSPDSAASLRSLFACSAHSSLWWITLTDQQQCRSLPDEQNFQILPEEKNRKNGKIAPSLPSSPYFLAHLECLLLAQPWLLLHLLLQTLLARSPQAPESIRSQLSNSA